MAVRPLLMDVDTIDFAAQDGDRNAGVLTGAIGHSQTLAAFAIEWPPSGWL